MHILVNLDAKTGGRSHGPVLVDGRIECYAIDPVDAIPNGNYGLILEYSHAFGCEMPKIVIPGMSEVFIHSGGVLYEEGLLVCKKRPEGSYISNARAAFLDLVYKIDSAYGRGGNITIEFTRNF